MYILGLSGALSHDCAACLMYEGKIVSMVEEERFLRTPHAHDKTPINAIEYCLKEANITLDEVAYIAISWDKELFTNNKDIVEDYKNIQNLFPKHIFNYNKFPNVESIDHHLAHAASAFYFSPFEESTILVIDGAGEDSSTTVYHGKNNKITKVDSIPDNQSLGEFYAAVTMHLGFGSDDAGKTMGLSSYGEPTYDFESIKLDNKSGYKIDVEPSMNFFEQELYWKKEFLKMGILSNKAQRKYNEYYFKSIYEITFSKQYKDFAASAQKKIEDCIVNLVNVSVKKTNSYNLCLAGGVALNCVANSRIEETGLINDIFIQPASHDAGTAIGAAAELSTRLGFKVSMPHDVYSGPSFTNDSIASFLQHLGVKYKVADNITDVVSDELCDGRIIGWFQGRAEFGPRALGNRSILADPSISNIKDKVNQKVKYREEFRPFGPSVLEEEAPNWFENINQSSYMLKLIK